MSRSQQNQTFQTSQQENQGYNANAQTSYNAAQGAEKGFEDQLSKYSASNPYVAGGEYQTATNQQMANTADAGAQAAGQAIQSAAVRTGQNPAGAIAATEDIANQNTRNLSSDEAKATQQRIGDEAGYNKNVLDASMQPASFEAQLSGQQGGLAQGALGTQEQAAQQPSFMDQLTGELISAGGQVGAGFAKGCWIAAELYGGWDEPRTVAVRHWIFYEFSKTWLGSLVAKAYLRFGERLAEAIKKRPWLRRIMRRVFDYALRKAQTAAIARQGK